MLSLWELTKTSTNDVEVVHVGVNSATIQNATFEGSDGTTFENNVVLNQETHMRGKTAGGEQVNFIWKTESNGSLSLAIPV